MSEQTGYVYILTNPSFPEYVKIGYADNLEKRLKELNRSECTPFAFRVYGYYKVNTRLSDMKLHSIIDKLNPDLRSIDTVEGKKRVREFYAMSAEDAFELFEAIAELNNLRENLVKCNKSKKEKDEEELAKQIQRQTPFQFSFCNIENGEKITFIEDESLDITVVDDKHVEFENSTYSLTSLAKKLKNTTTAISGPHFFKYKNEILSELRNRIEEESDFNE